MYIKNVFNFKCKIFWKFISGINLWIGFIAEPWMSHITCHALFFGHATGIFSTCVTGSLWRVIRVKIKKIHPSLWIENDMFFVVEFCKLTFWMSRSAHSRRIFWVAGSITSKNARRENPSIRQTSYRLSDQAVSIRYVMYAWSKEFNSKSAYSIQNALFITNRTPRQKEVSNSTVTGECVISGIMTEFCRFFLWCDNVQM